MIGRTVIVMIAQIGVITGRPETITVHRGMRRLTVITKTINHTAINRTRW